MKRIGANLAISLHAYICTSSMYVSTGYLQRHYVIFYDMPSEILDMGRGRALPP